jgi:hypothetical protein
MTAPFALSALKAPAVPDATDTIPDSDAFLLPDENQKPTRMVQTPPSLYEAAGPAAAAPATHRGAERPPEPMAVVPPAAVQPVASPSTAMALHRPAPTELRLEQASSWQKIWLALQQRAWTSVALVPTGSEISEATVDIAQALCAVGLDHLRQPMSVLDVREVSLGLAETRIAELRSRVAGGERVLLVVGPVDDNPAGVPLAAAADGTILCFKLGESLVSAAKKTVDALGRPRFLGAVALRPRLEKSRGR